MSDPIYPSMTSFPPLLHTLAAVSLSAATACAVIIALDEIRRPQTMWIMNLVWPLTALFGSAFWLTGYYRRGRAAPGGHRRKTSATVRGLGRDGDKPLRSGMHAG